MKSKLFLFLFLTVFSLNVYAHGKADFVSKLQIALKEANETSYWLLLLVKTNIIVPAEYDRLENLCREIRITLIASINTAKRETANMLL